MENKRKSKFDHIKVGSFFNSVLVLKLKRVGKNNSRGAIFKCHCNKTFERSFSNVGRGQTSCKDCAKYSTSSAKNKYIIKDRRLYRIWKCMNRRCHNSKDPRYSLYGGRGISVCAEWRDSSVEGFNTFYKEMGIYPTTKHSVDRIDGNGNYTKENCRWATQKEQMNNVRNNHILDYEGTKYTLQQLGEHLGMKPNTILCRLRGGHTLADATKEDLNSYKICKSQGGRIKKGSYEGKVDKEDRGQIERLLLLGKTSTEIAGIMGISFDIVARIKRLYLKIPDTKTLKVFNGEIVEVALNSSLTQDKVNVVLSMKSSGYTNRAIATELSVSPSTITNILRTIKYDEK